MATSALSVHGSLNFASLTLNKNSTSSQTFIRRTRNPSYSTISEVTDHCACRQISAVTPLVSFGFKNQSSLACLQLCNNFSLDKLLRHPNKKPSKVVELLLLSAVASDVATGSTFESSPAKQMGVTVLINGASGKMGQAVGEAAIRAGLVLVPYGLAGPMVPNHQVEIQGVTVDVYGAEDRDKVLDQALAQYPDLVIVDYTLPAAVNNNAEWYCERGVPFVMGTTGGDRQKLLETITKSGNYAVVAAQMGKQVVAFIAAMEALSDACPGAFTGYTLRVTESHQSTKVDTSGTAKEVVAAFQKLGVVFGNDEIEMVRDPPEQMERMKVPEEHLKGHAFHTYRLTSADGTVSFEFQHNVCGRTIYAEGTVDAVLFLAKKVEEGADKHLYNMIDVLRGGAMR